MINGTDYPHDFREPEPPAESPLLAGAMDILIVLTYILVGVALAVWATRGAD